MFERFSEEARVTVHNSKHEADHLGYPRLDTEHLLLALTNNSDLINQFFENISVSSIRHEIFARVPQMPPPAFPRDIPATKAALQALDYAIEGADNLQDRHVANRHILLGLLRLEDCLAAQILHNNGLSIDKVRSRIANSKESK
jgi:ATP-dependent Clp protease ATP-binding subunit ClpC